ncbi:DUF2911 domain-containing protein [Flavicella sediminum]|uniref:DUF2911 domain-containing protein n=1 Tax=Flavicella sediminum TaxID=2585141 RepID=UPI001120B693|nr:DUF2911 domain-containing protein [Flavicella sediminum]
MKKQLLFLCAFVLSVGMSAQVVTPQPSPFSKVEQKVGLTDVTLEYSRPGVRGRAIFGDLVPFGKLWRTGANKNTSITFSTDVNFGDKNIKAGTYALFTIPNKDSWEIILYADASNWGTPAPEKWSEAQVAVRVNAKPMDLPFSVDTFTIDINSIHVNGAALEIIWDKVVVSVPFTVPTDRIVSKSIEDTLNGPGKNDYYAAAAYYLEVGKDIKQAKTWIDLAVEEYGDKVPFWILRRQALIHAKSGSKKSAIKAAKKSLELAKEAGNVDYVKMNKDFLKEMGE